MGMIHKNVTIKPEHEKFLQENNYNISSILQNQIDLLMEKSLNPNYLQEIKEEMEEQRRLKEKFMDMNQKLLELAREKGFADEAANKLL